VTERVKIDVVLRAPDQNPVTATVDFCVWDMPGMDLVCQISWIISCLYWWLCSRQHGVRGRTQLRPINGIYIMDSPNATGGRCHDVGQHIRR